MEAAARSAARTIADSANMLLKKLKSGQKPTDAGKYKK
jgi:hypothetical protein